jgi:polysaccharide pyruvyl transferase WcaK-like protein
MNSDLQTVTVLHVASFSGNSGDLANHLGFRKWFEDILGRPIQWVELEIRDYYRKLWQFDDSFIDLSNNSDLIVFGGGNYLELWPEHSSSGTSIDLLPEQYRRIKTPIFFNALGVDAAQGISMNASKRFPEFLDYVLNSETCFLSVRNDGSLTELSNFLSPSEINEVTLLPDAGFFLDTPSFESKRENIIAINLACDMPEIRFKRDNSLEFARYMASEVEKFLIDFDEFGVNLIPHVFSDVAIISEFLSFLPDSLRRSRVQIAKYAPGQNGVADTISAYSFSKAVLGMRFHSSVIPIGMGIPTLGISTYAQISKLYSELKLESFLITEIPSTQTSTPIGNKLKEILTYSPNILSQFSDAASLVSDQRKLASIEIKRWLNQFPNICS